MHKQRHLTFSCCFFLACVINFSASCNVELLDIEYVAPVCPYHNFYRDKNDGSCEPNPNPFNPRGGDCTMMHTLLYLTNSTKNPNGVNITFETYPPSTSDTGFYEIKFANVSTAQFVNGNENGTGMFWVRPELKTGDMLKQQMFLMTHYNNDPTAIDYTDIRVVLKDDENCTIATIYGSYCAEQCDFLLGCISTPYSPIDASTTFPTLPPNPGRDSECLSPDRSKEEKAHDQAVVALVSLAIAVSVISVGVSLCAQHKTTKLNVP